MGLTPFHERVRFPSVPDTVARVDSLLDRRLRAAGLPEDMRADVAISVSEVVNNAVVHGNREDPRKSIEVEIDIRPDRIAISVQDEGPGFDPEGLPDPVAQDNLMREVGRGLFIVRAYMDEVHFRKIDDRGLRITMVKTVPDGRLN